METARTFARELKVLPATSSFVLLAVPSVVGALLLHADGVRIGVLVSVFVFVILPVS
jgi:hypothetical protein